MSFAYSGIFVLGVSVLLTLLMMRVNIVDTPSHRSSHITPTPRAGGVAIVLSLTAGYFFITETTDFFTPHAGLFTILSTATAMALMGLLDDVSSLSFITRLVVQGACAVICVLAGVCLKTVNLPVFGVTDLGFFGPVLTIFWVMAFTNTFNFFDGLNGLSTGSTLVALGFLAFLSTKFPGMELFYILTAAAILGFFTFNFPLIRFPHAQIFLGDAGSQFIGFLLAELAVFSKDPAHGQLSFYTIPLLFFASIFDIALTLGRRILQGENLTQGHRKHLFQLLQRTGWSHAQVSLLHCFFVLLQGVGAIYLQKMPTADQWLAFLPYLVIQIVYARWVLQRAKQLQLD